MREICCPPLGARSETCLCLSLERSLTLSVSLLSSLSLSISLSPLRAGMTSRTKKNVCNPMSGENPGPGWALANPVNNLQQPAFQAAWGGAQDTHRSAVRIREYASRLSLKLRRLARLEVPKTLARHLGMNWREARRSMTSYNRKCLRPPDH